MDIDYEVNARVLKVLSDSKRLRIIDLLSYGEKCACDILNFFDFSQPTLSYHMKLLIECGLVNSRKDAQWNHYSLNKNKFNQVMLFLMTITTETDDYFNSNASDDNIVRERYKECCR